MQAGLQLTQILKQRILDPQHLLLQQVLDPASETNVIDHALINEELDKAEGPKEHRDLQKIPAIIISFRCPLNFLCGTPA